MKSTPCCFNMKCSLDGFAGQSEDTSVPLLQDECAAQTVSNSAAGRKSIFEMEAVVKFSYERATLHSSHHPEGFSSLLSLFVNPH